MNCPVCNSPLQMTERSGVEIDYCPKCRGVWLDRGELDKIIERSGAADAQSYQAAPRVHLDDRPYRKEYEDGYHKPKKRRESFLGDLFDF